MTRCPFFELVLVNLLLVLVAVVLATYTTVALAVSVAVVVALFFAQLVHRRVSSELNLLEQDVSQLGNGRTLQRTSEAKIVEIGKVSDAVERLYQQLTSRVVLMEKQQQELSAVLSSMVEGVLVVDLGGVIVRVNQAALSLIGSIEVDVVGRTVYEAIPNPSLHRLVEAVLHGHQAVEHEVQFSVTTEKIMQGNANVVLDPSGRAEGAVIVLNDITKLRQLETMRRDFVANVSHELRTPITSIKGFTQTILDGAIENREDTERFVKIIAKQSERLGTIIDDLLQLSKFEQQGLSRAISLQNASMNQIISSALQLCEQNAAKRNITLSVDCPADLHLSVNESLLESALVNLVDNAISYSTDGSTVTIRVLEHGGEVTVSVVDYGMGIPQHHLPRVFERFYRVDEGRARVKGGTGLGLAIVKHIAQVHGGYPTVESEYGRGSTFSLHLPKHVV